MSDKKVSEMTANSTPQSTDLLMLIDDPSGSPQNQKITVADLLGTVSVKNYGAVGDGVTDDSVAFQAALDQAVTNGGAPVYVPAGNYQIDSKLTVDVSGASDHERILIYGDGWKSVIESGVIGDTTLEINDGQAVRILGLRFVGNNLTGASGNGHAIAFRDSAPQSGTFYPAQCDVRDCSFHQFRGDDTETTDTSTGVATTAAAIYMGPGLGNYVDRCSIFECGIGILFDECQNSHISRTIIDGTDEWGIQLDAINDGCSVSYCDIVNIATDGNGDPTVWSGVLNYAGVGITGNINQVTISDNKFKTGQALMIQSGNVNVENNFFRCDPPDTVAETWAIQADSFDNLVITGNDFDYLNAPANTNTRSALDLDINANTPCTIVMIGNTFNHTNDVNYDVRYRGAATANTELLLTHCGNMHGSPRNGRTTSTVVDCVVMDTLQVHGIFSGNSFTTLGDGVSAGGTITDCLDMSAAAAPSVNGLTISGNLSRAYLTGATITSGIEVFQDNRVKVFADSDATPSIAYGKVFETGTVTDTITDFDDGYPSQEITVISKAAITYDTTSSSLNGSSADIVTADGDVTIWVMDDDGTNWRLKGFVDASVDNSGGA